MTTVSAGATTSVARVAAPDASTSSSPGGRTLWRSARGPLAVAAAIALCAGLLGALRATGDAGLLDPRSYQPSGARALATLLADGGVPVRLVRDLPDLRAELGPGSTALVALPQALTEQELQQLRGLDAALVVVEAAGPQVDALGLPASVRGAQEPAVRRPACQLPAAETAGTALTGGIGYQQDAGVPAQSCYASAGSGSLLALPDERVTLLGSADLLTNEQLGEQGNAALALGLLGGGDEVVWLLPSLTRDVQGEPTGLGELVPDAVRLGVLQLVVAVVFLALWRARRLGRVVTEPLPVVVRAAETVEGRSRLYRAAGARDQAAEALRTGARDRLVRGLGLPADAGRAGLVQTLAARAGRDPAVVDEVLYGAAPANDAALVRLADDLDRLRP